MPNRGSWGRAWDVWLADATMLLATAAAAVLGPWASRESGTASYWLGSATVVSVVLAAWVKVAQTRRERAVDAARQTAEAAREREAERERDDALAQHARDVTTFGSAIKPSLEHLARLATSASNSGTRQAEYAAIRNRVVDAAATLTGGDEQVRAVLFRREDRDGVTTLVPAEYSGAREPSGRMFRNDPSDPAGVAVWAALRTGKVVSWPNVSQSAPAGWDAATQSRPYLAFTMAPVLGPDWQVYGMLNVDALEPDSFGRLDEERLAAFAALLGAAAHIVSGDPDVV